MGHFVLLGTGVDLSKILGVGENQNIGAKGGNSQGRKPRETGGTVPPKFEVGDGPCIRPPNILRSSVVGCARKYEKSKKRCFLVRKGLGLCAKGHVRHLTK